MSALLIQRADLANEQLIRFLQTHVTQMHTVSPRGSNHALDTAALGAPGVRVWAAWRDGVLIGTVALQPVEPGHQELKSMLVGTESRGSGAGRALLEHVLAVAVAERSVRMSLETGAQEYFSPARALYSAYGFVASGPFGSYRPDPASVFMTRAL